MAIKLIVGLRNPGPAYEQTRHNAGSWFAKALADWHNTSFKNDKKLQGETADLMINDHSCNVFLPHGFMNHSGVPVQIMSHFYRIKPEEILIVHDELDLPTGRIKLKTGGGNGGHNGLRDITARLGSNNFHRLRIGIGHPGHKDMVLNYVLGKPSSEDRRLIDEAINRAIDAVPALLSGHMAEAMNRVNG